MIQSFFGCKYDVSVYYSVPVIKSQACSPPDKRIDIFQSKISTRWCNYIQVSHQKCVQPQKIGANAGFDSKTKLPLELTK